MADNQSIGAELGRKLSVRELGFDKASILQLVLSNQNEKHFLARFIGAASGIKPYKIKEGERAGETAFGLMGQFEGSNADGEAVNGSVLYLPGYANDMVVNALSLEGVEQVRIGFDVYAEYNEKAATSYVFTVHDLLNTKMESVEEIKASIQALPMPSKTPALEAPKSK